MARNIVSVEGYVIRVNKFREADAILSVLTSDGMRSFIARGANKLTSKNRQATLVLNKVLLDVDITSSLHSINGVKTIEDNTLLYEDFISSACVQVAQEVISIFFEEEEQSECEVNKIPYDYFASMIKGLKEKFDPITLLFIFMCQVSIYLGVGLNIDNCVMCGNKKDIVALSYLSGGYLCKECAKNESNKITDITYLKVIRYGYKVPSELMTKSILPKEQTTRALFDIIENLKDYFGGVSLSSLDLLKAALNSI